MDIKKNLGKRIREMRIGQGLTQEQLADKLDISPKSLSQIEIGNNFVSAETLNGICNVLNVKPKVLFDFDKYELHNDDMLGAVVSSLKRNPDSLYLFYKLVTALEE